MNPETITEIINALKLAGEGAADAFVYYLLATEIIPDVVSLLIWIFGFALIAKLARYARRTFKDIRREVITVTELKDLSGIRFFSEDLESLSAFISIHLKEDLRDRSHIGRCYADSEKVNVAIEGAKQAVIELIQRRKAKEEERKEALSASPFEGTAHGD